MRRSRRFLRESLVIPVLVLTAVGATASAAVAAERNVLGEYFTAVW